MRRGVLLVVVAVLTGLVLGGCGRVESGLSADEREAALDRSAHRWREFHAQRTAGPGQFDIRGRVEDDYRFETSVAVEGAALYDEVVLDDERFLRLHPAGVPEAHRSRPELSPLMTGAWAIDGGAAAPEFTKAGTAPRLFGPDAALAKVRYLEQLLTEADSLERLRGATEHDADSPTYVKRDDKFPLHPEDGRRFNFLPAPYRADVVFSQQRVPEDLEAALEPFALYLSYWIKNGLITRIEVFFDVDVETVSEDIDETLRLRARRSGVPFERAHVPAPPSPYRETYTFRYPAERMTLAAPPATATVGLPAVVVDGP